jgi:putative transposase
MTPVERIQAVPLLEAKGISQRKACYLLRVCRSRLSYHPRQNEEREALRKEIRNQALKHPTYGYRRVWAVLRKPTLHKSRVYRLWKVEGLALPPKKRKRRKRFGQGFLSPPKALYPNHVWTYDFVKVWLRNGQGIRILTLIDECTRECLGLYIARSIPASKVLEFLKQVMQERQGIPEYLRSDNGPEFIETSLNQWLREKGTRPVFITPGSPWENGKCESFNGKFRDEFLNRHIHTSLKMLQVQAEWWRQYYNKERPHSALDYQTPFEFTQAWYNQHREEMSFPTEAPKAPSVGESLDHLPTRRSKRFLDQDPCRDLVSILQTILV